MLKSLKTLALSVLLATAGTNLTAQDLAQPAGDVILTISGAITITNDGDTATFDLAMLDALDQRQTTTETPWYDGAQEFSGPTMAALLTQIGATGSTLRVVAINDYAAEMPITDATNLPVILASRHAGNLMSVRDKGPLFVIYPFSEMPELSNEVYFNRSVWQVKAIEVLP